MPRSVLTVTVNPVLDYMSKVSSFSVGKDVYSSEFTVSAGGKGINVSRTLGYFGNKTVVTGFIGGITGGMMEKMLDDEKIRHDFLRIPNETRKSITLIDPRSKITRIIENGPAISVHHQQVFFKKFKSLLPGRSWVVISGRPANGIPEAFYKKLIKMAAQQKGVKVVLDTSGQPLSAALSAAPFLIKPNVQEAEAVLKKPLKSMARLKEAVRYFLSFGIKIVIISLGQKGAVAGDKNNFWFAKAPWVNVKNTVGCGDAMIGGFIDSYEKGRDTEQSLKTAVAAGTANCLTLQPGAVSIKEVLKLRKKVEIERLMLN